MQYSHGLLGSARLLLVAVNQPILNTDADHLSINFCKTCSFFAGGCVRAGQRWQDNDPIQAASRRR
eukprot:6591591-Pyramimonas_sp.AAC.1